MAKKWYPVIGILTCLECGTCVGKCTHGVYDKNKAPVPVVMNPDNCFLTIKPRGDPASIISYIGDCSNRT